MQKPSEALAEFKQGKSGLNAAMPEVMKHLDGLFQVSQADGALSAKVKVLIGLGIGLATHCEACILVHMEKALAAGASRAEILEACGVAIAMGGGPTMADVPLVLKYLAERTRPETRP